MTPTTTHLCLAIAAAGFLLTCAERARAQSSELPARVAELQREQRVDATWIALDSRQSRVLVVGGVDSAGVVLRGGELLDAQRRLSSPVDPAPTGRRPTLVRLADGRVLGIDGEGVTPKRMWLTEQVTSTRKRRRLRSAVSDLGRFQEVRTRVAFDVASAVALPDGTARIATYSSKGSRRIQVYAFTPGDSQSVARLTPVSTIDPASASQVEHGRTSTTLAFGAQDSVVWTVRSQQGVNLPSIQGTASASQVGSQLQALPSSDPLPPEVAALLATRRAGATWIQLDELRYLVAGGVKLYAEDYGAEYPYAEVINLATQNSDYPIGSYYPVSYSPRGIYTSLVRLANGSILGIGGAMGTEGNGRSFGTTVNGNSFATIIEAVDGPVAKALGAVALPDGTAAVAYIDKDGRVYTTLFDGTPTLAQKVQQGWLSSFVNAQGNTFTFSVGAVTWTVTNGAYPKIVGLRGPTLEEVTEGFTATQVEVNPAPGGNTMTKARSVRVIGRR